MLCMQVQMSNTEMEMKQFELMKSMVHELKQSVDLTSQMLHQMKEMNKMDLNGMFPGLK